MNNYQMLSLIGATFVKFNSNITEDKLKNKYYVAIQVGFGNTYLYLPITSKLFKTSTDSSYVLLLQSCRNISKDILATGVDGCFLNTDYILSKALKDSLTKSQATDAITYVFPNLIRETGEFNIDYFDPLFDTNNKDIANINFFKTQNMFVEHSINESEIKNFRITFINFIYNANFDNNGIKQEYSNVNEFDVNTPVYKIVMNYFKNEIVDNDIIFKSIYSVLTNIPGQSSSSNSTCNICTTSNSIANTTIMNDTTDLSCVDTYKLAMSAWLQQMFGNIEFYCQWFYENINNTDNQVNTILCDKLIELIDLLLNSDYDLSLTSHKSNNCSCPDEFPDATVACSNPQILINFKQAIEWIKLNELDANINKIKTYGQQFGGLLQKLIF